MLERLEELQDTKDELDQKTANLLKAEKALARWVHALATPNQMHGSMYSTVHELSMHDYNSLGSIHLLI